MKDCNDESRTVRRGKSIVLTMLLQQQTFAIHRSLAQNASPLHCDSAGTTSQLDSPATRPEIWFAEPRALPQI